MCLFITTALQKFKIIPGFHLQKKNEQKKTPKIKQ